jgi:hypothetical protein
MSWTFQNSSNDPGDIAWSASPTSGVIEAFGETVVEVVVSTRGLNARDAAYLGFFNIYSSDVCVCREQSLEMAIELVVTAETSATNSLVEIDSNNVEASGELRFYIIPVDAEGLLLQDSGGVQFNPILTWAGDGQTAVRTRRRPLEEVTVVCSVKYLSALDTHVGLCRMPTLNGAPLAGSFSLSVQLTSGELIGGSEYSVEVTSCPRDWFYHKPTGTCVKCDLEKSVCRGGKELPVPKQGFWSDLANAELGYVFGL